MNATMSAQDFLSSHTYSTRGARLSAATIHQYPARTHASGSKALLSLFVVLLAFTSGAMAQSHGRMEAARLNSVGIALMNQQLTEKALAKFELATAADPTSAIPLLNKGIALLYLQRLPEAEKALQKAASIDPKNLRAWYNLGLEHLDSGNPKLAIDDMQHVLALDPADADAQYYMGSFYLSLGDSEHAITQFQAALRLNPVHASAEFGLARALQRAGRTVEAHEHLKRFQHLTQSKISAPLSVAYGERGRYCTMEEMVLPAEPVGPMIPVHFVAQPLTSASSNAGSPSNQPGRGACILDLEGTGRQDLVVLGNGDHAIQAYRNLKNGSFESIPESQTGLSAKGEGVACAVGDYDNDGLPDLAVAFSDRLILFHNLGKGHFADTTTATGIQQLNHPEGLTFIDFDHDGDLDLFVTGAASDPAKGGPNVLWRNNGNSTFTEWTSTTALAGQGHTEVATLSDINNDRAVDLVVTGSNGAPTIYENAREGAFRQLPLYSDTSLAATRGLSIFDFDKNGWMDIAVTHAGAPGLSLWRNIKGQQFERVSLPLPTATGAWGVTAIDFDNDGWIDLVAVMDTANGQELHGLRNRGPQGFEDVSQALGFDKIKLTNPRSVITADIDQDGAPDLIVTQLNTAPFVLKNVGGNRNHSLRIALTGLADNKTALGTKVEVFANGQSQKFEVSGASGYLGQGSTEILAGLGQTENVDVVRMLWPTGVPQDEIDIAKNKTLALKELDRRGSSCPVVFAWDGKQYQFISDIIGAAVVGHWVSPTSTNKSDPDEWLKVDGNKLQPRNGYLSLRFGEPMEEVNFIDQLRLVAVDHPEGTEVYPDERFLNDPPFASGKAVVTSSMRPLAGAWDDKGNDVLQLLAERDHHYVRDFANLSYAGYATPHTLTMDLGQWSPKNPLRLLMYGYIEYFSASSMYAAWQANLQPTSPKVEAQLPDGSWKQIIGDMGFPAGLPRTIVVDLTGKMPAGARRIRITTNLQIYWDQVLVDNGPDLSKGIRQTEVPLASAHLAFRGYPKQVEGETPGDLTYRYDRISATGPFLWARGSYTRYGDVTSLLNRVDNQDVIFGTGEEIDAEFHSAALPALPPHWKRDYFFYANGFVKDMDFYEASPFTVAQMPFHEMSQYPYPASEQYPDTPDTTRYLLNWNDRFESGKRMQRFQFHYAPATETPILPQH